MRQLFLAAFCVGLMSCASSGQPEPLYNQLGGEPGITTIVDELLIISIRDQRIAEFFDGVDIDRLHGLLSEQICDLAGGPCAYGGVSMAESHRGMGVDNTAFNALVENLQLAMESQNVSVPAQNRLLALLAPMHSDIVAR